MPAKLSPLRLVRLALSFAVAAGLAGFAAVALIALIGFGHRWTDIIAQFVAPVLVGALGLLVLCLVARLWRLAFAAALTVVLTTIALWPQAFPPQGTPKAGAPAISLYSANLWAGNSEVDQLIASIRQAETDMVVLVELGDVAAARLDEILQPYPHRLVTPRVPRQGGAVRAVVASRWPVDALPMRVDELASINARVATPLGPVNVIGVHLTRPWPYQYQWAQIRQVMNLSELRHSLQGPVIVAGDFNSVSSARIGKQVRQDAGLIAAPGWPGTWPAAAPSFLGLTIDQVYRSPDLALLDRQLGAPMGSDHRPVITRFTLAETPAR